VRSYIRNNEPGSWTTQVGLFGLLAMSIFDRFARAAISVGHLRVILPSGEELSYGDPATTQPPVVPGGPCFIVISTFHVPGSEMRCQPPSRYSV